MNNLILDCSCGMNVYVVCNDNVFSVEDKIQNKHSDEVLKVVDDLLNKASIKINDIDNICVCVGPGSFTGIRVAISVVKGLAIGVGAKVFVLSNFDIFEVDDESYYLVLDGFSNFVYVRTVKNGMLEDECIDVDEFKTKSQKEPFTVYVTTEKAQNLLNKYEILPRFVKNNIINAFNKKIESKDSIALNQILPVYLRASQAEIEREKKK